MGHSTKSKRKPPPKAKIKEGRPTLYDPQAHPDIARKVMGEGKTLKDLAAVLEIARSTLDEFRKHPEFSAAIQLGQEDNLDSIERALSERARGYQHASVKVTTVSMGEGMGSRIELVPIEVIYPPDTAAASLVLRNKRGDIWKDKQQVEHVGLDALAERLAESRKRIIEQAAPVAPGVKKD